MKINIKVIDTLAERLKEKFCDISHEEETKEGLNKRLLWEKEAHELLMEYLNEYIEEEYQRR